MKQLNFKKIKLLHETKIKEYKLDNKSINLIDINYNQEKHFRKFLINQTITSKIHSI